MLQFPGYQCLDPTSKKIYISRHVQFDESSFPFAEPILTQNYNFLSNDSNTFHNLKFPSSAYQPPTPTPLATQSTVPTALYPTPSDQPSISTSSIIPSASTTPCNTHPMTTRGNVRVSKPNPRYAFHSSHMSPFPSSYIKALADPN